MEGSSGTEFLLVPKERIAVIIGKKGKIKAELERLTNTKIEVDSQSGEVNLEGNGVELYRAANIVKAIGRGFSPEKAFFLVDEDYFLEVINLVDFVGKSEKALTQRKARVIGRNGKARNEIESKTNAFVSVYGKTIAIIGKEEGLIKAKKAIEMLLEGAEHKTVYKYLSETLKPREEFEL